MKKSLPRPYYDKNGITLYHADCLDVLSRIRTSSIDMVLTDPPYGHNNNNNGDLIHNWEAALGLVKKGCAEAGDARPIANDGFDEANELVQAIFKAAKRVMKPGSCCCCCGGGGGPDPQFARWSLWMDEAIGFKQAVVWDKGGLGMGWHYRRNYEFVLVAQKPGKCKWYGGHDQANVVKISGIKPSKHDHPTVKPIGLFSLFIRLHSQENDIILDPFCGSGVSLIAAKKLGRRAIGIEIDEQFCEMAVNKLEHRPLKNHSENRRVLW